jgi:hypothetical protein
MLFISAEVSVRPPPFLLDPITWSENERLTQYRVLAARYRQMADAEERAVIRNGLLALTEQCEAAADSIIQQAGKPVDSGA